MTELPQEAPPPVAPVESSPPPARYGAKQASFTFLAFLGSQFVIGLALGFGVAVWYAATHRVGAKLPGSATNTAVMLGAVFGTLAGGAIAYLLAKRAIERPAPGLSWEAIGWSRSTWRVALFAALIGVLLGAIYILVIVNAFPPPKDGRPGFMGAALQGGGWILYAWAILAVLIAPPVEEFMFRGVLWTGFSRSWGPVVAAIVVTLVFVVIHLTEAAGYPPAMLSILAMAVAALAARILTGSLVPPILLHAAYNSVIVTSALGFFA